MSLVGFSAKNHRQQTAKRGALALVDNRRTPPEIWGPLNERWSFTVDAAADPANAMLSRFWTVEDDALTQSWAGERVWCNPPYSSIEPWVKKAWWAMGTEKAQLVVMLLPANRTEQRWWQEHIEPWRDGALRGGRVLLIATFLPGRLRFTREGWTPPPKGNRPPFGCVLLTWRPA